MQVLEEDGLDGLVLTFAVEENPVVRQVTLGGNENLDEEKIKDNLTLTTGSTLDYPLLFENRQRIEALYRAEGYYLAKVRSQVEELPSDSVGVHFEVDEGEKLKLRRIEFVGNEKKTNAELTAGLKTKPWRWYSWVTSFLDKSGTYSEPVFVQDLETVSNKYLDDGYVRADVGQPEVVPEEDGLVVRVPVSEGDQYHLGKAKLEGDETVDFDALREDLELADGAVFSRGKLNKDLETIESHYTDRGFFMAKVQPLTNVDEAEKLVDITYEVAEGLALLPARDRRDRQPDHDRSGRAARGEAGRGPALLGARARPLEAAHPAPRLLRGGELRAQADGLRQPARPRR